jgi:hypothetical protein
MPGDNADNIINGGNDDDDAKEQRQESISWLSISAKKIRINFCPQIIEEL